MPFAPFRTAVLLALLAGVCGAGAVTVDIEAVSDTSIFSAYPDNDFGASTLESGTNGVGAPGRALFRFDLSSIPAGATITDANITITVVMIPPGDQHAGPVDSNFGLFPMLVDWQEGTQGGQKGGTALPGDSTWNERGAGEVAFWSTPGGQIGSDYANSSSTATSVGTHLGTFNWGSNPQVVSDFQSWLDDPSTNFGYMMISDKESTPGSARRFASRESPGGGVTGPTLTVTYDDIPEPGPGSLLAAAAVVVGLMRRARKRR